ncbi:hypothetical protein [Natronomonas moolapensis]|uniref:hypothetical protein n=1 Tax=Natronomonas moolapensis TaxID=416273 RepID=UPI00136388B2|nr:hypothetical protein [Natronomonas moolapensis]
MSTRSSPRPDDRIGARVLEVSDLPVSRIDGCASVAEDVHFERRGGRTFLVTGE